uniref:TATA box binding protein associated factor (TAF) histone-like fold domain-containing protein n=2 Tax=Homalodisca liturata TaxID=320908 RepID=A0A1B6JKD8_9HEMI
MDRTKIKKETPTKSTSIKTEKLIYDKKITDKKDGDQNAKKYLVISPDSISSMAETIGIADLPEEVCSALAEDVSYKLREIIHNCSVLVHNNKRRKLLTEDVNRVLQVSNAPTVYGHSVAHEVDFTHIPKAEVFVENDSEIDIVAMSSMITAFTKSGEEYVKGCWLSPDPVESSVTKDIKEEPSTSGPETPSAGSSTATSTAASSGAARPPTPQPALLKPPSHFINYYLQLARVVIGGSEPHLRVALTDLRTNSKIRPLVPYFLNLVALSVNKLQRNGRLTDALLRTVEALVDNPHVDPSSQLAVNRAVNALLVVAIEPKAAKNSDDLLLRKRAAYLLAKVLICWSIELKQQMDIVRQLLQLLLDGSISLKSHYGAVVCLTALGQRTLDSYFWPILERYINVLRDHKTSPADAQDVESVKGAIMIAAERMYRRSRVQLSSEDMKRRRKVEEKLYEFLGDALVPRFNLKTSVASVYPGTQCVVAGEMDKEQLFNDVDMRLRESLFKICPSQSLFTFKPEVRGTMPKLHMYSVFSLSPYAFKQPKEIVFNFIGSNQVNTSQLKRRKIGESLQREFKTNQYRFSQMWRLQKALKKTRSIKYCYPMHKKSSVGDLFAFM